MEYEKTKSNFGWEIRRLRRKYNFTREMLAHEVDGSVHYITQLENGKVIPSEEMQQAILEAIECFNPETPFDLLIDYCRIRFPKTNAKFVIEKILGLRMDLFDVEERGFWGYSYQYFRGDIIVMCSEKEDFGTIIEMSGLSAVGNVSKRTKK